MRWLEYEHGWVVTPSPKNSWAGVSHEVNAILSPSESRLKAWEECKKFLSPEQADAVQITKDFIQVFDVRFKLEDEKDEKTYSGEDVLTRAEWTKILTIGEKNFALQRKFLVEVLWMHEKWYYWTGTEWVSEGLAYYFWIPVGVINRMTLKTQRLRVRKRA